MKGTFHEPLVSPAINQEIRHVQSLSVLYWQNRSLLQDLPRNLTNGHVVSFTFVICARLDWTTQITVACFRAGNQSGWLHLENAICPTVSRLSREKRGSWRGLRVSMHSLSLFFFFLLFTCHHYTQRKVIRRIIDLFPMIVRLCMYLHWFADESGPPTWHWSFSDTSPQIVLKLPSRSVTIGTVLFYLLELVLYSLYSLFFGFFRWVSFLTVVASYFVKKRQRTTTTKHKITVLVYTFQKKKIKKTKKGLNPLSIFISNSPS